MIYPKLYSIYLKGFIGFRGLKVKEALDYTVQC